MATGVAARRAGRRAMDGDGGDVPARRRWPRLSRSSCARWSIASPWACWSACRSLLLLLGKADVKLAESAVEQLSDASVPVLQALNQPVDAVRSALRSSVGELLAVYDENARLREENRRLLGWQAEAAKLEVQNRALRRMLSVPAVGPSRRPGPRRAWSADSGGRVRAHAAARCRRRAGRRQRAWPR